MEGLGALDPGGLYPVKHEKMMPSEKPLAQDLSCSLEPRSLVASSVLGLYPGEAVYLGPFVL